MLLERQEASLAPTSRRWWCTPRSTTITIAIHSQAVALSPFSCKQPPLLTITNAFFEVVICHRVPVRRNRWGCEDGMVWRGLVVLERGIVGSCICQLYPYGGLNYKRWISVSFSDQNRFFKLNLFPFALCLWETGNDAYNLLMSRILIKIAVVLLVLSTVITA